MKSNKRVEHPIHQGPDQIAKKPRSVKTPPSGPRQRLFGVLEERIHHLGARSDLEAVPKGAEVVYWMSRDQRVQDNWALIFALRLAAAVEGTCSVVFALAPAAFLGAPFRHYHFMLQGLQEVERKLAELGIPFTLLLSAPEQTSLPITVADWLHSRVSSAPSSIVLVTDFSPLRLPRQWKAELLSLVGSSVPWVCEVDAHNVIPARFLSDKQEWAARTIRPKVHRLLDDFLFNDPHPLLQHQNQNQQQQQQTLSRTIISLPFMHHRHLSSTSSSSSSSSSSSTTTFSLISSSTDWPQVFARVKRISDTSVGPVSWITAGEDAAGLSLSRFLADRLKPYAEARNDPCVAEGQSQLSPYLHFGHISAARVALEAAAHKRRCAQSYEAFIEELVVRRELAENFCLYNERYDAVEGFPAWARKTLDEHRGDPREYTYSREQFSKGETHDALWNAAQLQMVATGKMHGFMRMYWAKKILEWTDTPEQALEMGIYLNDRYSLDGRDPNGYVGVAWSVGGVHDRAWPQRAVFGKIRFMNYDGCKRKFSIPNYISLVQTILKNI